MLATGDAIKTHDAQEFSTQSVKFGVDLSIEADSRTITLLAVSACPRRAHKLGECRQDQAKEKQFRNMQDRNQ